MNGVEAMSTLALAVWQHALRHRGASVYVITARLERALQSHFSPADVSCACQALRKAGFADRSAFGYRLRQVPPNGVGMTNLSATNEEPRPADSVIADLARTYVEARERWKKTFNGDGRLPDEKRAVEAAYDRLHRAVRYGF